MKKAFGQVLGLPFLWAVVWAMPGFGIELLSNLGVGPGFATSVDMWPQTLGIPGLIAGVGFAALVAASGRWRTVGESSFGMLLGLGAIVGLAMIGIIATGFVGGEETSWTYVFAMAMSLISAVASGLVFRFLARRHALTRAGA